MKTINGYKFIQTDMTSNNGNAGKWRKNTWKKHKGELELCGAGFHACRTPLQSLDYVYGSRWFEVEARGKIVEDKGDKFVAQEMRIVKELPIKPILVEFAIRCAERCINNFEKKYPEDKRPREAIEAAKAYVKNPTKKNQDAAGAAEVAAWAAAREARAARAAAREAALAARAAAREAAVAAWAARAAAREAAGAAWAARAAERKWQARVLNSIIRRHTQ